MTGFAQGRFEFNNISMHVQFKSLNHRYLDFHFRGTGVTPESEKMIKAIAKGKAHRGKIEVQFDLFQSDQSKCNIQLNDRLLTEILDELSYFKKKYKEVSFSMDSLLRIPMIFHLDYLADEFNERDAAEIKKNIQRVFDEFIQSREEEGRSIAVDIGKCVEKIEVALEKIKEKTGQLEQELFNKYKEKIGKYLQEYEIDERRVAQEAAILAEKACINEEIHRLETHTRRLKSLLSDTSVEVKGRETDFLAQEMLRESHTIGSKITSMEAGEMTLEIRREIEKIKQQVQNVE